MATKKHSTNSKKDRFIWLLIHSGIYSLCIASILFVGTGFSRFELYIVLMAGATHFLIDLCKAHIPFKRKFSTDQILHLISLVVLWRIWGECIPIQDNAVKVFLMDLAGGGFWVLTR